MKWQKKGLICSNETIDLPWYKRNTMLPLPYLIDSNCLRVFVTMCDEQNVGRIGYVDVDPENPSVILGYSKNPILDIGEPGSFSDSGVLTSSLLNVGESIYLYYSAYQKLGNKIPYSIFSGVAVSNDNGSSFTNITKVPILDRVDDELFVRAAPYVFKRGGDYQVFYVGSTRDGWVDDKGKLLPTYEIKQFMTSSCENWCGKVGRVAIPISKSAGEFGLSKVSLWFEDEKYKVLYAIRSFSNGYRLGYAESFDGVHFERKDDQVGIDVSQTGWDSEMITFPERYSYQGRTFLFYCGNHYGMAGMGYAELIIED